MFYRLEKEYPDAVAAVPLAIAEKIEDASENEIRIFLMLLPLLREGSLEDEDAVAHLALRFRREEVLSALAFWRGCGMLVTAATGEKRSLPAVKEAKKVIDADEAPFYTSEDLAKAAEEQKDFKSLVAFAEERLEKVMNTSELARLYSFLDYLKMPADVVMLVIEDSAAVGKKSLRYITKLLTVFLDEGIDTYDKAEAYFARRKEKNAYEAIVRELFGLGTRKLTKAEDDCVSAWRGRFGFGREMLEAAYEKTVASAKNPSIKYMHKILEGWYQDGVTTPEEIEKNRETKAKAEKSFDSEDFFQSAVSKGRKNL